MSHELTIEAYSCPSPQTPQGLESILSELQPPTKGDYLTVLPEYFIDGEERYSGRRLDDEMVMTLVEFSRANNSHLVFGMVEQDKEELYITGVFTGPEGIIGTQRKKTPTSFERKGGIQASDNEYIVFESGNSWTLSIIPCIDIFNCDEEIRKLSSNILANIRGFDLDDPTYGNFSKTWLARNKNMAIMGKRIVVGATGANGSHGPMAEVIDFEGEARVIYNGRKPARSVIDLEKQRNYREGVYISPIVPKMDPQVTLS